MNRIAEVYTAISTRPYNCPVRSSAMQCRTAQHSTAHRELNHFFFPFPSLSFFPPANISKCPAFCAKLRSVFATRPEVSFYTAEKISRSSTIWQ